MFDVQFLINAQQMDRPVSWGGGWRRKGTYSSLMNQLKQENFIIFGTKILSEPNIVYRHLLGLHMFWKILKLQGPVQTQH